MRIVLALFLALLCSCSEEHVSEEWDEFVSENSSCESPDDCAVVYPGCPLGCFDAVNVDSVDEANELAEDLIDRYESVGRSCDYDCMEHGEPECVDGLCTVEALEMTD